MKNFLKSLKRQDGFTLVELMVVVAIIGLLSAVAIPNFKKYQAKAKMSEAKLQLSAIYTAESSFFSDFNIYHTCLAYMGFDPNPEFASRYFAVGFIQAAAVNATAQASAVNSGLQDASCPATNAALQAPAAGAISPTQTSWFHAGKGVGSAIANTTAFLPATTLGIQDTTTTMLYTVGAAGVIDGANTLDTNNSELTMTQGKIIAIVRNGY